MQSLLKRYRYFFIYTLVFILMTAAIYYPFYQYGKVLIWNGEARDGLVQHYNALLYYSGMLKDTLHTLIHEHRFSIQEYSFSLGLGSDTIKTLHYYAIGDPLNLFSAFIPERLIYLFYCMLIILRLYLSGISFSVLAINRGNKNTSALLAGSMVYVFCGFALFSAVRHPYFINPMIYLPFILTGVHRFLEKGKPALYIFFVAIAAMSNFYFLYMIAIITAVYIIVILIADYRSNLILLLKKLAGLIVSTILSAVMASVILFPVINAFLHDARMDSGTKFHLLYPAKYYRLFLAQFISFDLIGSWTMMSYGVLTLAAVYLMFRLRKSKRLILFFILAAVAMLTPYAGYMLNGMAYPSNRWEFAFTLLCAYILVKLWPDLISLSRKEAARTLLFIVIYGAAAFWLYPRENIASLWPELAIGLTAICIIALRDPDQREKASMHTEHLVLATVLAAVFVNGYFWFSPNYNENMSEFLYYGNFHNVIEKDSPDDKIRSLIEKNQESILTRYDGIGFQKNAALRHGTSSTQFFWSLSNPYLAEYRTEMLLIEDRAQLYGGFDANTFLNELAGVGYSVTGNKGMLPYGYEYADEKNGLFIYKNKFTLPIGYTYDSYIMRSDYEKLSAAEKAEAMMQGVVLKQQEPELKLADVVLTSEKVPYHVTPTADPQSDVCCLDGSFVTLINDASCTIPVDGRSDSETILNLENLAFSGTSRLALFSDDRNIDPLDRYTPEMLKSLDAINRHQLEQDDAVYHEPDKLDIILKAVREDGSTSSRLLSFGTPYYKWYANRKDYNINFGYSKSPVKEIRLSFSSRGVYSFDSMAFTYQPMSSYEQQAAKLAQNTLEDYTFREDTLTGHIHLDQTKLLCLAIPYDTGWTAYADGKEMKILQANTAYMGLILRPGDHDIRLVYQTPYLRIGAAFSAAGWIAFLVLIPVLTHRKKRKVVD